MTEAFALPEVAALSAMLEGLRPSSHPTFIDVAGAPGSGRTRLLAGVAAHLASTGWSTVSLAALPGQGSDARSLAELASLRESGSIGKAEAREAVLLDDAQHASPALLKEILSTLAAAAKESRRPHVLLAASEGGLELPLSYPGEVAMRNVRIGALTETALAVLLIGMGVGHDLASRTASALVAHGHTSPRAAGLLADALRDDPEASRPAIDRLLASGMKLLAARRFWQLSEEARAIVFQAAITNSGINHWRMERLHQGHERAGGEALTLDLEKRGWLCRAYDEGYLRFVLRQPTDRAILLELMGADERQRLHAGFASMLASDERATVDVVSEMGRHQVLAGHVEEGAATLLAAGKRLLSDHRHEEAAAHFDEVVRLALESGGLARERLLAMEGLADAQISHANADVVARAYADLLDRGGSLLTADDRARLHRKRAHRALDEGLMEESAALLSEGRAHLTPDMKVETALYLEIEARLQMTRGDHTHAAGSAQDALSLATELGDQRLLGRFHLILARLCFDRGDYPIAILEIASAHQIFEAVGDVRGSLRATMLKGNVCARTARYDEAATCYEESKRVAESINDVDGMTTSLMNLATLQVRADDLDRGEESLRHCLRIYRRTGNLGGACSTLLNLGAVALQRGECQRALATSREAVELSKQLGNVVTMLHGKNCIVTALMSLGQLKEALDMATDLQAEARATGNASVLVHALHAEGSCRHLIGDFDAAEARLQESLHIAKDHQFANETWDNLNQLVEVAISRGALSKAREFCAEERAHCNHPFQDRETMMHEIFLRRQRAADRAMNVRDLATLERLAAERDEDVKARTSHLIASCLSGREALAHAERACGLFRKLGYREWLSRAVARVAALEEELGIASAQRRYEEAAGIVLAMAAGLDAQAREVYLQAFGRNDLLQKAFGSRQ